MRIFAGLIIITLYYLVPHRLSTVTLTQTTLNNLERLFYVCDDDNFAHYADE